MTARRSGNHRRRPATTRADSELRLWQPVSSTDQPEPIQPAAHPGALIESLGPPPLRGSNQNMEHYLVSVVERAAGLATALAASADLLAVPDGAEPTRDTA